MADEAEALPLQELLATEPPMVYHERQSLQLCAVHALNNLFCNEVQDPGAPAAAQIFTKQTLEEIAARKYAEEQELGLSSGGLFEFNQNRSAIGLGNYSVVVLETAVREHGTYSWEQFDTRKDVATIPDLKTLVGIIVNKPSSSLMGAWKSKHWYTIRRCRGHDLNLDSKLEAPAAFAESAGARGPGLREHLQALVDEGGSLFLVTNAEPEPEPELEPEPEPEPEPEQELELEPESEASG